MKVTATINFEPPVTEQGKAQLVELVGRAAKVHAESSARRLLGMPSVADEANAELARRIEAVR